MRAKTGKLVLLGVFVSFIVLYGAAPAQAQVVGVGISPGKISVDEPLSPGGLYHLPPVTVTNRGEEAGYYEMVVTYLHEQEELMPPAEWFEFGPENFYLEPDHSQTVAVTLEVATDARPGDYCAYIEARPVIENGGVTIGVAAATKLSFAVEHEAPSFFKTNALAFYVALGVVALIVVVFLLWRFSPARLRLQGRQ
jgi:hypothetical protein